jgi:hypothetical protein
MLTWTLSLWGAPLPESHPGVLHANHFERLESANFLWWIIKIFFIEEKQQ